jgi:hypothetical protein
MSVSSFSSALSSIGTPSPGTSRVGLEAQLNRLKQQLSSCVNCQSARTLSGKADIQDINNRIGATEARLSQIEQAESTDKTSKVVPGREVTKVTDISPTEMNVEPNQSKVGFLLNEFA